MKRLLYIGNKLSNSSSNITTIETLGNLLIEEGHEVFFSSNKTNKIVRIFDMLLAVIRHRKVDYVLIDTYSTLNFYYAFFVSQLCRLLKIKYIPILHGGNLPMRLKRSPKKSKLLFKHAHSCISPSQYLKASFEDFGLTNITYIPNTIEIDNYPFLSRTIDKPRLLWVRSFKEIYNPLMAIKVARQLADQGLDVSLCMVGPDGDGSYLYATSLARELGVDVSFTGKLPRKEWIDLSKAYNIFINTSFFDNMPVSLIEAMALGLPVVSTNVGGIPTLVNHNEEALLVDADNVIQMTKAVKRLIDNPEFVKTLTMAGRKKAEEFDWLSIKRKWQQILK